MGPSSRSRRAGTRRAELLAAGAVLVLVGFIVQPLKAQQASRMALTAAIAEAGTVRIDRSEDALGIDYAVKDGHLFSDKAPLQPVLAVPLYVAYRGVGGESATHLRVEGNLGLWWISLWSAALPLAALVVVGERLARPWTRQRALLCGLALAAGTLLLPFGSVLFSHTASALLVGAALLAWRRGGSVRGLVLTGALLGVGIGVEYTLVAALAVFGLATLLRDRGRVLWLALGAAPPLLAVMAYHWVAFGAPLRVPYRYHVQGLHNSAAAGLTLPTLEDLWTLATSVNGLFVLTPVVALGLVGLVLAWRVRPDRRWEVGVALGLLAAFVVIQAGAADLTGGASLGPRYATPALPGLVIGIALVWDRLPLLTAACAGLGAALMALATYTDPLRIAGPDHWLALVGDGEIADTVLDPVLGPLAPVVLVGTSAALAWLAPRGRPAEATG